jgi:hypothetical protein
MAARVKDVPPRASKAAVFAQNFAASKVERTSLAFCSLVARLRITPRNPPVLIGKPAIVIHRGQRNPAFPALTQNERFPRFALRIKRVEFLIETFFGRLAGIDGAAEARRRFVFRLLA